MRTIGAFMLVLFLSLAGCDSSQSQRDKLTTERVQTAIDTWRGGNPPVKVLGVAEEPSQNSATADLQFSRNFKVQDSFFGPAFADGPGTATFKHYTDGRWVMTNITCRGSHAGVTGLLGGSWDINIEVR